MSSTGHSHDGVILLLQFTTKILFLFPLIFKFCNPSEIFKNNTRPYLQKKVKT